jgi:RNA polymerase sigma factor (sigma-70 family)
MAEMSETELLQAFRTNRSEQAFAELVRRYANLVYSVARRRVSNASLAEDITQIVFIRFASAPPTAKTPAELAAWLHRLTVNATIDMWRSETRRRHREEQAVTMEPAHAAGESVWNDIAPQLDEALNELHEDDRQALLLRFFAEKTMREVGAALGVSEAAAKMRVTRAVDRLRKQLGVAGTACTAAALGVLLSERTVEAAPGVLVAQLAAIRLPPVSTRRLGRVTTMTMTVGALIIIGVVCVVLNRRQAGGVAHGAQPAESASNGVSMAAARVPRDGIGTMASAASPKKTRILFHVVDAQTGVPISAARIRGAYFGVGGTGEGQETTTDDSGEARILEPNDPAKNSGPNVFVVADGYVPKAVAFREDNITPEYTIKLDAARTAAGIIVDDAGAPVSGVTVLIRSPGTEPGQIESIDFQTCPVTNREDGAWSCSYIPPNFTEINFVLQKAGYAVTHPVVPVSRVNLTNLVFVIDRGFSLSGQVTDSENQPVAKVRVRVIDGDRSKTRVGQTDNNGVFHLTGLAGEASGYHSSPLQTNESGAVIVRGLASEGPVHVDVTFQAEGYASQLRKIEFAGASNIVNQTLFPGNVFRGRVVDESGRAISNAVVQTDSDREGIRWFQWSVRTDADGRFEWDSAPAGEVLYWIEADGYKWKRDVPVVADGSDHEFTLTRVGTNRLSKNF